MRRATAALLGAMSLAWAHTAAAAGESHGEPADSAGTRHYVSLRGDAGTIFQTNDFLKGDNKAGRAMKDYRGLTAAFGWQTDGSQTWHHVHNFPSYGVGVYTAWLDNEEEIGRPVSVYGFYRGTLGRWGAHRIGYHVELGVAFNWDCYDGTDNPKNITIGSPATVHIGLGAEYTYTIARRLVVGVGGGLTHFSNGAVRKPNKGLNLGAAQLRMAYLLEKERLPLRRLDYGKPKGNEIDVTIGFGVKSWEVDTARHKEFDSEFQNDAKYVVSTLTATFLHRYCHRGKYGAGVSVVYDEWLDSDVLQVDGKAKPVLGPLRHRFCGGAFATHELCIDRLAILTQLGFYFKQPVFEDKGQKKYRSFQRAGVKYTLPFNMQLGLNIFAHRLTKADFIEWNLGYAIPLKRNASRD